MTPSLVKSANDGEEVKVHDGQLFLGVGAELLTHQRLSVGHPDEVRPSGIFDDYRNQDEIGTTDSGRKRQAEEETRSGYITDGSALMLINPGSEGGLRMISNNRDSPRPA